MNMKESLDRLFSADLLDRAAVRVLAALALAMPLAFCWRLYDTFDLAKITLLYAGVLLLLVLRAAGAGSAPVIAVGSRFADWPVILWLAAYGLALCFSWDIRISFWGQYQSYVFGWLALFFGALVYAVTASLHDKRREDLWITAVIWGGAAASLYGVLQYLGLEFRQLPANPQGRVWSSFGNPLYFGAYCMMVLPLALQRFLELSDRGIRNRAALLSLGLLGVVFAGLLLSLSRSAWVGSLAGLAVYGLAGRKEWRGKTGKIAAAALLLLVMFAPARARFVSIFLPSGADAARIEGWKQALKIFGEDPVFGTGPDTFIYSFRKYRSLRYIQSTGVRSTHGQAHNDVLQYAATSGILGLLAYLGLWFSIFRAGWAGRKDSSAGSRAALSAALVSLFVHNQFNFWSPATLFLFWFLLGILAAGGPRAARFSVGLDLGKWTGAGGKAAVLAGAAAAFFWVLRPALADYHFLQSKQYQAGRNYQEAAAQMENAIRKNRGVAAYYENLSNLFKDLAALDAAAEVRHLFLNNALVVSKEAALMLPRNPDAQNNLGVAQMWMTRMAGRDLRREARESFEMAVELDPNFADAWANLARVAHFYGDAEREIALWKKVLEIDPENADASYLLPLLLKQQEALKKT